MSKVRSSPQPKRSCSWQKKYSRIFTGSYGERVTSAPWWKSTPYLQWNCEEKLPEWLFQEECKNGYGGGFCTGSRDRNGDFSSNILGKHSQNTGKIEGKAISLYASGMFMRDISGQMKELFRWKYLLIRLVTSPIKSFLIWKIFIIVS